ncbi:MAG: site-2 protease family protein [Acidobacteria bacterium]|nr:site-2 protease family protein [Acidobacteriota bacterium]
MSRKQFLLSTTLFILTFATTTFIGGSNFEQFYLTHTTIFNLSFWIGGLTYSVPLMAILFSHEMGHYLTAKKYGLTVTPPYFVPAPTLIGTFGAFIRIKSPFFGKRELFDVGIAGPIAGFAVAVPVLITGLFLSRIITVNPAPGSFIDFGKPVLYMILEPILFPRIPAGGDVLLHPTAFAGWIGMLVTSLNLLPVGQLDGGHIAYAVLGKKANRLSFSLIGILALLSYFYEGWLLWIGLLLLLGLRHPALPYMSEELDSTRKKLALLALIIFILSFMPVPVKL